MHGRQEWLDSHPLPYPVPGGDLRVQLRPLRGHTWTRRPSRPRSQLGIAAFARGELEREQLYVCIPRTQVSCHATPWRRRGCAYGTTILAARWIRVWFRNRDTRWRVMATLLSVTGATKSVGKGRSFATDAVGQWKPWPATRRVWHRLLGAVRINGREHARHHHAPDDNHRHVPGGDQADNVVEARAVERGVAKARMGYMAIPMPPIPSLCRRRRRFRRSRLLRLQLLRVRSPSGERGQQNSRCPGVALERQGHPPGQLEGAPGYARHTIPSAGEQAPAWPGEGANPCPNRPQQSEGGDGGFRTSLGELLRQASHPSSRTVEAGHAEQLGLHAGCFCHRGHGGRRRRGCHQRGHGHSVEGRPRAGHSATHGHVERNSEATASPGRLPNTTSRSRQGRGHGGLQSQPRIKACSYKAAPWRRLNRSQHKGLFRRITTVLAAEAFQQQTWQHSVVMETDYVSPMLAQLIGLSQALEVQLGPWPFLQLIADPRIEPDVDEIDVSAVWDTAYINGSCATSSCAQHEAWIGARGSMDNTATIEPSHASCYGSMTVSAQGSLIGQASTSSIASVHNSESSSCTVDPASRIFAQMDDCLPSVVAGPREWEHVQLPPPHASYPEVLPASPSGLRPCISASGHGIGRRKHVSFGFTVAFWFPSASQLQLPRPPLCSDDDACSAAPCFVPLEQEAAFQVKQVRHVGLRLPTNCPDLASGPGYTQARHVGIRPPCSSTCLDSSLSHHRQSGASEESCTAFSVPQAEHVGFRSPGFVTQASPPQVAAPLGSALSP